MIWKRALIGGATGAVAAGAWWAGITPGGEGMFHPVPILGGAIAGALVGTAASNEWWRNAIVSGVAGVGGATVAQYIRLRWFAP